MSIKIGSISAKDIYIGSTPAKEIRLGSTLIWSRVPEEVYYTLTLNGVDSEGIKGYSVYINEVLQPTASTYQILKGSFVQVYINVDTNEYYYDFTSNIGGEADAGNGWYMDKDVTITVSTSRSYYTLTVNLEGGYEAFYDGYTIYVDGVEFARIDSSGTFSIPHGATVSTYNNSSGINGCEHSESVMPLPSYNADGSWIMNNDYVINVVTTLFETAIINIETWFPNGEGVITTQFKLKDGTTKMDTLTFNEQTVLSYEVLQGSNFEIISLYDNAHTSFNIYSNDLPATSGQALTTFIAINDGTITIESTSS